MTFWDLFSAGHSKNDYRSRLHEKISKLMPDSTNEEQILVACVAGLHARIAYSDLKVHKTEVKDMKASLTRWSHLDQQMVEAIVTLSLEEVTELAGLENHKYCDPLNEILDNNHKYQLLESLFHLAAADGHVEECETEEIRIITRGLLLEQNHFLAARATVLDYIKSLKAQ